MNTFQSAPLLPSRCLLHPRFVAASAAQPQAACAGCAAAALQRPGLHREPRRHPAVKASGHVEEVAVACLCQLCTGRGGPGASPARHDKARAPAGERLLNLQWAGTPDIRVSRSVSLMSG